MILDVVRYAVMGLCGLVLISCAAIFVVVLLTAIAGTRPRPRLPEVEIRHGLSYIDRHATMSRHPSSQREDDEPVEPWMLNVTARKR